MREEKAGIGKACVVHGASSVRGDYWGLLLVELYKINNYLR